MSEQISFDNNSINALFDDAVNANSLSSGAAQIMIANLDGNVLAGAGGSGVDSLATDDVVLLQVVLDESGSMDGVQQTVIDEANNIKKALLKSKVADSVLTSFWKFNTQPVLLQNWTQLANTADLTTANYDPNGGTAMYLTGVQALTSMEAYAQTLARSGVRVRRVSVMLSDGADNSSGSTTAHAVKTIADDMISREMTTLAFIGFGDKASMTKIGKSMGYPAIWTASELNAKEIRAALEMVSGSVIQGSMGTGNNFNNQFFTTP